MNAKVITALFEGKPVTTIVYDGRPAWIAREIGAVLGFSRNGQRLVGKVTGAWAADLVEGYDYRIVEGRELAWLKRFLGLVGRPVGQRAKHMMLLYGPGLAAVTNRCGTPVGGRLRRFVAEGLVDSPNRATAGATKKPPPLPFRDLQAAQRLDLSDRRFRVATLDRAIMALEGRVPGDALATLRLVAAEVALDRRLTGATQRRQQGRRT